MIEILIRDVDGRARETIRRLVTIKLNGSFKDGVGMGEAVIRVDASKMNYVEGMLDALGCYSREVSR